MNTNGYKRTWALVASSIVCGASLLPVLSCAQDAPPSHVADPGVYKVLAENEQFRVVLATWKPGQRDVYHSHPANAVYRLTDCDVRAFGPDNRVVGSSQPKAGTVNLQAPIPSHSLENVGSAMCQMVIVERK
jgi:beta-alanine degradation protein BauB